MVISVANTDISESSINDFFHKTEISVLELCNQVEIDLVRSSFINEADEGGEEKKSSSKFATFIATIKLKIEELARKVTDAIRKMAASFAAGGYIINSARFLNKDYSETELMKMIANDKDFKYYKIVDLETAIKYSKGNGDFESGRISANYIMSRFEVENYNVGNISKAIKIYRIMNNTDNPTILKDIDKMKKDMIKYVNQNSKDNMYNKDNFNTDEATKLIKFSMNWYTAALKSITYNFRALSMVTKKYLNSMKEKNKKSNESNKGE